MDDVNDKWWRSCRAINLFGSLSTSMDATLTVLGHTRRVIGKLIIDAH